MTATGVHSPVSQDGLPHYDVIVLGAGPGGSTAALRLAQHGARVLLVDRERFPRSKPCGGGVLVAAAARLPFSLRSVSRRVVYGFRVTYKRDRGFAHTYPEPLAIMTRRRDLDTFLAGQAVTAGATFADGRAVSAIHRNGVGMIVDFHDGERAAAAALVAADGANGVSRRALDMPVLDRAVALEANSPGLPRHSPDHVSLDLGSLPGGYGWLFPKDGHTNIGVGGWPVVGPQLKTHLAAYATSEGFSPAQLEDVRGYTLPLRRFDEPLTRGSVAFVGDAAGLIDPLSGEGIHNAFYSAQLAADEIARYLAGDVPDLRGYERAVRRHIDPELAVARQLQALFHQRPWPYVRLLRHSGRFWRSFCRTVRGEATYVGFKGRLGPAASLVDLAAAFAARGFAQRSGWSHS